MSQALKVNWQMLLTQEFEDNFAKKRVFCGMTLILVEQTKAECWINEVNIFIRYAATMVNILFNEKDPI